ncbi:MAG TPA: phosphocholine cytidylyltransferase family protein [Candidatus Xenobia bacterium]|nr:phosphocholine cytidylyltransferase family protein [Candidatus Xenobia bacterium]
MAERLAVILAAGAGTRLRPRTGRVPKCLLEVGGRALLDYQLDALARHGLRDVLLVTGFGADQITPRYAGRIRTVHNPDFEATNNLHSLWAARREFAGRDFLCLHADVLFHPAMLRGLLESPDDACFLLDRELNEETMKARLEGERVVEISKSISPEQMGGTFLGLARFAPPASSVLPEVLDALARDPAHRNSYFTACVPELSRLGLRLAATWTNGLPWIEIDFEADLERAGREVVPLFASWQ